MISGKYAHVSPKLKQCQKQSCFEDQDRTLLLPHEVVIGLNRFFLCVSNDSLKYFNRILLHGYKTYGNFVIYLFPVKGL